MKHTDLDAVIIGQGLAGTTLAWHLVDRGLRIAVFDDGAPVSASKVSAGLLTPVMGKNLTRNDDVAIAAARTFYQDIQNRTGARFFRDIPAVRLFANPAERTLWAQRRAQLSVYLLDPQPDPLLPPDIAAAPHGGFAMSSCQLDAAAYLTASRAALPIVTARIDPQIDVTANTTSIRVAGLTTRRLIFCEGFAGAGNPYFPGLPYQSAKGDIVLVRLARPRPPVSIHRRMWLAPTAEPDVFRAGATFNRTALNHEPTAVGRAEIETELNAILACRYDVIGHMAAVRPIFSGGARIGASRADPRIFLLNGLGTKGATRAPGIAAMLTAHMIDCAPLPDSVNLDRLA